ncbi:prolyl aminopeptidase [Candidatus Methylospira mobilis]|uniref:Proline iminopeptidase n=1 Tax=Candidatus Methylospira mobilis TaxID=1808979 RepID=A0A5Q0BK17_9GAMM|nr:prolyl aminopeptidase [Candidatus Methylospira mobilis]QFY44153.1 prolyl aminopeptidase [Candidatus Methylospira mobilis]WNV06428.1 prolyl aminopeptidase [Candidatus Methylospira mobilis]
MKSLYPPIQPYQTYRLDVGDGHVLYVEESGNRKGLPVVYLHGGPGSGCKPFHHRFFNPERYRTILLDQRGSGRSTPSGGTVNNTTQHLIGDLEAVRLYLKIKRWVLFAGSWGSTLALLYAQQYPKRVAGMLLRGSFLARQRDLDWYIRDGANRFYPEQWDELLRVVASPEPDLISALHGFLYGQDEVAAHRAAKAWLAWGAQLALGATYDPGEIDARADAGYMPQTYIELHYAMNKYFIEENQILQQCHKIPKKLPVILIHGRHDVVCPPEASYLLKQRLPAAELLVLPNSGHLPMGDEMLDALVSASDRLAQRLA